MAAISRNAEAVLNVAGNKIKRLEARVAELRATLEPFARMSESYPDKGGAHVIASHRGTIIQVSDLRAAHDALTKSSL